MSKKVPKWTIYNKIKRSENGTTAKIKLGSGRIAKQMNKRALDIDQIRVCKLLKKELNFI